MRKLITAGTGIGVLLVTGLSTHTATVRAQQAIDPEMQAKILKGFQIAPVPLNMGQADPTWSATAATW